MNIVMINLPQLLSCAPRASARSLPQSHLEDPATHVDDDCDVDDDDDDGDDDDVFVFSVRQLGAVAARWGVNSGLLPPSGAATRACESHPPLGGRIAGRNRSLSPNSTKKACWRYGLRSRRF